MEAPRARPIVGRAAPLHALDQELAEVRSGDTRFVLVSGEPGIGKTRLTEAAEESARAQGFAVVRGRCSEVPGAPAFWPFRQLLRGLREEYELDPASVVGADSPALALLDWREPPAAQSETDRFRLFADVAAWIGAAARRAPLVLILDNLHAADPASGRLLSFVVQEVHRAPLLVLGTARDAELAVDNPLSAALGELAQRGRLLPLGPLSRDEVVELAAAIFRGGFDGVLGSALHERSGGNPLFVRQLAELLAAEAAALDSDAAAEQLRDLAPDGVRHVIRHRLARLEERERRAVTMASVLGREFPLDLLEALGKAQGLDDAAALVDGLAETDLVRILPGTVRRLGFTHVLIRDVIYADTRRVERRALHASACEVIRSHRDLGDDAWLSAAAHHALVGECADALPLATQAGERTLARHAHEEAASWLGAALRLLDEQPESTATEHQRAVLFERLATARWRGGEVTEAREYYARAFTDAREAGDAELFAAAALGWVGRTDMTLGSEDEGEMLLREALERIGGEPGRQRAELLTRLAAARYFSPDAELREGTALEAVECAERVGEPGPLAYALSAHHYLLSRPGFLSQRIPIARRLLAEAERSGEGAVLALAHYALARDGLEAGDLFLVDRHIADLGELAQRLRQPFYRWQHAGLLATRALLSGDFTHGEALAARALEIGEKFETPNALPFYAGQLYAVRRAQGRLGELEPFMAEIGASLPEIPAFGFARAEAQLALGRVEEARAFVRGITAREIDELPDDFNWPSLVSIAARLCVALEDEECASALYPHLARCAGTCVVLGMGTAWDGAYELPIGRLATLLGRFEEAEPALAAAAELHARLGARAHLALAWLAWAELCARRGAPGDRADQQRLAREAGAVFEELGMKADAETAASLEGRRAPASQTDPPTSAELRRKDDEWVVAFAGEVARVPHSRGMSYLAALVERPGEAIHVLDLTAMHGPERRGGDLGEVLDARARAEIRQRLRELEAELEGAEADHDLARADALREELQTTEDYLVTALGLGGRARRAGDPVERARKSVYNRLRDAIARVEAKLPELGRHLRHAVRTGRSCMYAPERSTSWRIVASA